VNWNPRSPVALIGTLDTKGEEILYLKERLHAAGLDVLVVDVGVLGAPPWEPDVSREEIAQHSGTPLRQLVEGRDRGRAVSAMERGLAAWIRAEHATRGLAGVLAIGGSAGTTIATAGMRELPTGVPKLMVSTLASGNTRPYVGTADIAMMYPVGDFTGLNRLTRGILTNAANAMAGMCSLPLPEAAAADRRPLLAATMFGVTTPCVNQVKQLLERQGFELLVFHATGSGGQAMERLVRDGFIEGVLDLTTTELADEVVGGVLTAGPERLEAAGRLGIPQLISVGALDMVNFGPIDSVPEKFRSRNLYQHNPTVTLMRTTPEENAALGRLIGEKASRAAGAAVIVLPLEGVSAIDAPGQPFHDPVADAALFEALRRHAGGKVRLVEVAAHINDAEFASRVAEEFLSIMKERREHAGA
jgi:uncharacterized protein (UPF0261 family)